MKYILQWIQTPCRHFLFHPPTVPADLSLPERRATRWRRTRLRTGGAGPCRLLSFRVNYAYGITNIDTGKLNSCGEILPLYRAAHFTTARVAWPEYQADSKHRICFLPPLHPQPPSANNLFSGRMTWHGSGERAEGSCE